MSKKQMERARDLIQQKRYSEARDILTKIDHPTAQKWINQIDTMGMSERDQRAVKHRNEIREQQSLRGRIFRWSLLVCGGCFLISVVITVATMPSAEERHATETEDAIGRAFLVPTPTFVSSIEDDPTITNVPALSIVPTLPPTRTGDANFSLIAPTLPPTRTATYPPDSDAARNATANHALDGILDNIRGVVSVGNTSAYLREDGWLIFSEIIVQPGYETLEMAKELMDIATGHLGGAVFEFSVILDDGTTATSYLSSVLLDDWNITPMTLVRDEELILPTTANINVQSARPDNCAEAVAMGLTAQQAGEWSHLDRDNDGVACYGD